jgi:hypothetical protein
MKKFSIQQFCPAIIIYTFELEAENEEEALHKVMNGEVESTEMGIEQDEVDDYEFNVEEIE